MFKHFKIIVPIAFAIAYCISPIDAIPDVLIGPGQLDDLAVIALAAHEVRKALKERKTNGPTLEHHP